MPAGYKYQRRWWANGRWNYEYDKPEKSRSNTQSSSIPKNAVIELFQATKSRTSMTQGAKRQKSSGSLSGYMQSRNYKQASSAPSGQIGNVGKTSRSYKDFFNDTRLSRTGYTKQHNSEDAVVRGLLNQPSQKRSIEGSRQLRQYAQDHSKASLGSAGGIRKTPNKTVESAAMKFEQFTGQSAKGSKIVDESLKNKVPRNLNDLPPNIFQRGYDAVTDFLQRFKKPSKTGG